MSRAYEDEDFVITDDRPYVATSVSPPKFHLNDSGIHIRAVSGSAGGPYTIADVDTNSVPPKYKLSAAGGALVDGGKFFAETQLEKKA
ncbi:MAG: hypothetical protein GOMPHAMPRED_001837 [Gomphillus americanus]|uniref:Uncharacterized protein n=1 Tax=Gomphillus americanus TaxID=1940652 RepID=A0A8H3II23_9LECA|nr:MAG: hypothetical protein GOMPHAMPRED_001837 [Gomphillus americanus]